jgi:glycosyltransferase involved in cell wall biosynthesis
MESSYHHVLGSSEFGGAGLTALRLAKSLNNRMHKCRFWMPGGGPMRKLAEEWNLTTGEYPAHLLDSGKLQSAVANWRFGNILRRQGPGIVHLHSLVHYGALQLGLRLSGLKRVVHVQLEEDSAGMQWAFKHPPDMIITCAKYLVEYVRRSLAEKHQGRQRIVAVPNSVDTNEFFPGDKDEAKRRTGAATEVPLILVLANLAPHKGQETAIRAVAELKMRGVDIACWLTGVERGGEGTYTGRLRSLISELGVNERVRLMGYRHDAPDLLRAADFFLLPSTHEGLPISILEAQASKVPVLASPTAGIPEVVADGETGFLIPADDHVGYANCIQTLLRNRDLYQAVAEDGYDQVRREYEWANYCERIWGLYCELLDA